MRQENVEQRPIGWEQTGQGPNVVMPDGRRIPFRTSGELYRVLRGFQAEGNQTKKEQG